MKVIKQLNQIREYRSSKQEEEFLQEEVYDIVLTHINSKIEPKYTANYVDGYGDLRPLIKKLGPKIIMEAIDVSAQQYLKYEDDTLTEESAQIFYDKIGGIAVNRSRGITPWDSEEK
jgi:hypothetical protein